MLKYDAPKGCRVKTYSFHGVEVPGHWWLYGSKKWIPAGELKNYPESCSTHANCGSVRAFRRMLRKHPNIRGKAILCSRFVGYDVYG